MGDPWYAIDNKDLGRYWRPTARLVKYVQYEVSQDNDDKILQEVYDPVRPLGLDSKAKRDALKKGSELWCIRNEHFFLSSFEKAEVIDEFPMGSVNADEYAKATATYNLNGPQPKDSKFRRLVVRFLENDEATGDPRHKIVVADGSQLLHHYRQDVGTTSLYKTTD